MKTLGGCGRLISGVDYRGKVGDREGLRKGWSGRGAVICRDESLPGSGVGASV